MIVFLKWVGHHGLETEEMLMRERIPHNPLIMKMLVVRRAHTHS